MKKMLVPAAGIIIALVMACGSAAHAPTATTGLPVESPIPTPTTVPPVETATPTATTVPRLPTSTPIVPQEWELQEITVDGNTVTVSLNVFTGIDVDVTVSGVASNRVDAAVPTLKFVFENVAAGEHPVVISDLVGFIETATVIIKTPEITSGGVPGWLAEWVADLESGKVEFPPQSITRYQSQGETVYYVVHQCCDQFSDLLDTNGILIGHPDGGITGRGDGVTQFSPSDLEGEEIWPGR